jgi:cytochrome b
MAETRRGGRGTRPRRGCLDQWCTATTKPTLYKSLRRRIGNLAGRALALVVLHVPGVVLSRVCHRKNLVQVTISGYKRAE